MNTTTRANRCAASRGALHAAHAHTVRGAASMLAASVLAACGGGGSDDPPIKLGDVVASVPSETRSLPSGLPQSYVYTGGVDGGNASWFANFYVLDGSRGRLLDMRGHFAANFEERAGNPIYAFLFGVVNRVGQEESSRAAGVSQTGVLIGSAYGPDQIERGFAVLSWTGERYLLPDRTQANFVSDAGLIGGQLCAPQSECLTAFHWSREDPVLTEHPNFRAAWMNNAGLMIGHHVVPDGPARLATVDRDGTITPLAFDPGPSMIATPKFIADDGTVFIDVERSDVASSAIVISNGTIRPIGHGSSPKPAICGMCDCIERATFRGFSATGHAVGVTTIHYWEAQVGWKLAAEAGFHWSASDGLTVIKVGEWGTRPHAVNSQGVVVGALTGGPELQAPFVWHRDSGGVPLRDLLPQSWPWKESAIPLKVEGIGDAGHLLLRSTFREPDLPTTYALSVFTPDSP
jgi:hypothetical protein